MNKPFRPAPPLIPLTLLLGVGVLLAQPSDARPQQAPELPQPPSADSARVHVVRPGDTLWDLAGHYYRDPFLWPRIHEANTGLVANPHLILPSWRLRIPGVAADVSGIATVGGVPPAPGAGDSQERAQGAAAERTVFYRDGGPQMDLGENVERALVPAAEHYTAPWLSEGEPTAPVGELMGRVGGRPSDPVLPETAHPRDRLYLRYGGGERPSVADRLLLVRELRPVEGYGRIVEPRAIVEVTALQPEVMEVVVVWQFGEVAVGDLAVPVAPAPDLTGKRPEAVADGPTGELVALAEPQSLVSVEDRAFVDLGRRSGVGVGDELEVVVPARAPERGAASLPALAVGRVRVLKVGERTATVKVIQVEEPVIQPGLVVRLVGRIP